MAHSNVTSLIIDDTTIIDTYNELRMALAEYQQATIAELYAKAELDRAVLSGLGDGTIDGKNQD